MQLEAHSKLTNTSAQETPVTHVVFQEHPLLFHGQICGTTAMRNHLYHYYKIEIREEITFGSGSGIDAIFLQDDQIDPPAFIFGRSIAMEADVVRASGIYYREQPEMDDATAWVQNTRRWTDRLSSSPPESIEAVSGIGCRSCWRRFLPRRRSSPTFRGWPEP